MSAIVDEAIHEVNRVDASDIETARNIGLEDDMFQPVQEMPNESHSRMPPKDYMSDHDSVIDAMNQMDDENMFDASTNDVQQLRQKLQDVEEEANDLQRKLNEAHR